jgi:hypothetical protein
MVKYNSETGAGGTSSFEIEEVASSSVVFVVVLSVESNVVASNGGVESRNWGQTEAIQSGVHVGNEILNCLLLKGV